MKNVEYKSIQISEFYKTHRMEYKDFYDSEKYIIEKIFNDKAKSVLDIGCACGGLGRALSIKFNISEYTGVDINKKAIQWAIDNNHLNIPCQYIADDILNLRVKKADIVFSLSCADWNIETKAIIEKSWESVNDGGYLVISLRLTKYKSINNINDSYQYIDFFEKDDKQEKANYVIYNINDALKMFTTFTPVPIEINAYGYYGKPSTSAVTPYSKLLFAVFAIKKDNTSKDFSTILKSNFPLDIFCYD
jgi:SAM-dependent methyltransferase